MRERLLNMNADHQQYGEALTYIQLDLPFAPSPLVA